MARRWGSLAAAVAVGVGLLAAPPRAPERVSSPPYRIVEHASVAASGGLELRLGAAVDALPPDVSREAYDQDTGEGILQWRPRTAAPVLLLAAGGQVHAISLAYEPRYRTARGVGVGDPASSVHEAYGDEILSDGTTPFSGSRYVLAGSADELTVFDTSCTNRVNAIGLVRGAEGIRLLGTLWQPSASADGGCGA